MLNIKHIFLIAFAAAIAACGTTRTNPDTYGEALPAPDNTLQLSSEDLRISPLDEVTVDVFGVDELSNTYQVDLTGRIKVPLVGDVDAEGLNAFELSKSLESLYAENYLQDPQINVTVKAVATERITIEGSVKRPGLFPLRGNTTLLQAIAQAGGPDEFAATDRVLILRVIEGERMAAGYDLKNIRDGSAEDPQVFGNDVVVVDGSTAKRNYRELLRSTGLLGFFLAI